jgi:hypothetical protein
MQQHPPDISSHNAPVIDPSSRGCNGLLSQFPSTDASTRSDNVVLFRHRVPIRTAAHLLNRPQLRPLNLSPPIHAASRHRAPYLTPSHVCPPPLPPPPISPFSPISPLTKPPSMPIRHPEVWSSTSAAALVYSVFAGTVPLLWWPSLSTVVLTFALPATSLLLSTLRRSHPCQSRWSLRATLSPLMIAALNAVTPC